MSLENQKVLKKPYKLLGLSVGKKKTGGRNNQGRITAFHRGGGNKLRYIYLNKSTAEKSSPTALPKVTPLVKATVLSSPSAINGVSEVKVIKNIDTSSQLALPTDDVFSKADRVTHQLRKYPLRGCGISSSSPSASTTSIPSVIREAEVPVYNSGEVRYLVRDPNRTAWIAGIYWSANSSLSVLSSPSVKQHESLSKNNNLWYSYYSNIIAPEGLTLGTTVTNTSVLSALAHKDPVIRGQVSLLSQTIGNKALLKDLMIGTIIHNIDGKYIRSAGCSGIIISKSHDHEDVTASTSPVKLIKDSYKTIKVTVKLQSGQYKVFSGDTLASIGIISNGEHKTRDLRKAGQKRWLGRRPIVRGVAMNPIDHPHGGGEGKSSGGRPSVTPWGKPTKGKPTRSSKRPIRKLVQMV